VTYNGVYGFRGELKAKEEDMSQAENQLVNRMCDGWPQPLYGPLDTILGLVVVGTAFRLYAISRGLGKPRREPACEIKNLANYEDRLFLVDVLVNYAHLLKNRCASSTPFHLGFHFDKISNHPLRLDPSDFKVHKRFEISENISSMLEFYDAVKTAGGLVGVDRLEATIQRTTCLEMIFTPVANLVENPDRAFVQRLCRILRSVHLLGWVHLDLRWPNILCTNDGQPLIIDWEYTGKIGAPITITVPKKCFDPRAALSASKFDAEMDYFLVGKMLELLSENEYKGFIVKLTGENLLERKAAFNELCT
jgi:hypothetical protein